MMELANHQSKRLSARLIVDGGHHAVHKGGKVVDIVAMVENIEDVMGVTFVTKQWFQGTADGKAKENGFFRMLRTVAGFDVEVHGMKGQHGKRYIHGQEPGGKDAERAGIWVEAGVDAAIAYDIGSPPTNEPFEVTVLLTGDGDLAKPIRRERAKGNAIYCLPGRNTVNAEMSTYMYSANGYALWLDDIFSLPGVIMERSQPPLTITTCGAEGDQPEPRPTKLSATTPPRGTAASASPHQAAAADATPPSPQLTYHRPPPEYYFGSVDSTIDYPPYDQDVAENATYYGVPYDAAYFYYYNVYYYNTDAESDDGDDVSPSSSSSSSSSSSHEDAHHHHQPALPTTQEEEEVEFSVLEQDWPPLSTPDTKKVECSPPPGLLCVSHEEDVNHANEESATPSPQQQQHQEAAAVVMVSSGGSPPPPTYAFLQFNGSYRHLGSGAAVDGNEVVRDPTWNWIGSTQ